MPAPSTPTIARGPTRASSTRPLPSKASPSLRPWCPVPLRCRVAEACGCPRFVCAASGPGPGQCWRIRTHTHACVCIAGARLGRSPGRPHAGGDRAGPLTLTLALARTRTRTQTRTWNLTRTRPSPGSRGAGGPLRLRARRAARLLLGQPQPACGDALARSATPDATTRVQRADHPQCGPAAAPGAVSATCGSPLCYKQPPRRRVARRGDGRRRRWRRRRQ